MVISSSTDNAMRDASSTLATVARLECNILPCSSMARARGIRMICGLNGNGGQCNSTLVKAPRRRILGGARFSFESRRLGK